MAGITIRRLDEGIKSALRLRAATHGRSMEEEAREILKCALTPKIAEETNLVERIRRHLKGTGGVVLKLPQREPLRDPADFAK